MSPDQPGGRRSADPVATVPVPAAAVEITAKTQHARPTTEDPKLTLSPDTTAEDDRKTAGQRRINILWELTQALIALSTVLITLVVAASIAVMVLRPQSDVSDRQLSLAMTAFLFLSNVASLVIGFYFGRTNHQRTGGTGSTKGEER